jgi:hypothetical protein
MIDNIHDNKINGINRHFAYFFIFTIVGLNSQIFFFSVHNPISIPFLREIFITFLCFFLLLYLLRTKSLTHNIDKSSILILFLVFTSLFASIVFAKIQFDQPFFYGLIEERRTLSLLVFFPIIYFLDRRYFGATFLEKLLIFYSITFVIIASTLWVFDTTTTVNAEKLRGDRIGIGLHYVALATIFVLFKIKNNGPSLTSVTLIVFFAFDIIFLGQTRQVFLAVFFVFLFMYRDRKRFFAIFIFLFSLILIFLSMNPPVMSSKYQLFIQLFDENYLSASSRALTISKIYSELLGNYGVGFGALSEQYRGGFISLYGPYFYLSDVGIFGEFYRYGFLAICQIFFIVYILNYFVKNIKYDQSCGYIKYMILYLLILWPTGAILEYHGFLLALILSMAYSKSKKINNSNKQYSLT